MKVIVITGSTSGIGYGLAKAFLERDCAVTISGRSAEAVEKTVSTLSTSYGTERVFGCPCDVIQFEHIQGLWMAAKSHFGQIDIWINNAGISNPAAKFWEHSPELVQDVIQTNVIGAMFGSQVALRGMLAQGSGAMYNLEGLGNDGRIVDGLALYGSTKAAIHYLDRCLARQTKGTPVLAGAIAPGMVITNLVTGQYKHRPEDLERLKPIFNIIAERVETVTPVIAEKILANRKNGALITFSSPARLMLKFISAPFKKRDLFTQP
jgi:NAD(P)-dependent dehydrogenase (short-subunit alcohol dehydrogenase family)